MNTLGTLLVAGALALPVGASAATIFSDGFDTFDSGTCSNPAEAYCNVAAFLNIPGTPWKVDNGNVDIVATGAFPAYSWNAHQGNYSLDLVGTAPGGVSTSLATQVGQLYEVSFYFSRNPYSNYVGEVPSFLVGVGGLPAQEGFATFDSSALDMGWTLGTFQFTAAGASSELIFTAVNGVQQGGVAIDSVTVAAVPEPSEWALLVGGLMLVMGAARHRRRALRNAGAAPA